ncbi:glycine-rich domain-containing protein [Corynebacterium sp. TAE3-ERU16]|uniref:glycine-rich domain-containing protein n=1 Tax=Corynebacterium sp. TAE3-ERU16 TaxID=2849493 RepID=UPI001C46BBF0|nr:hypothetical protein [Corynebacterium sp. TAE3-ERU16]MBV7292389.1 hypothetical protein [Corynebacterium sp. TAE3-ERU16]
MIIVDGKKIKQIIKDGENIREVWVDGVRVFSSRRFEVHVYSTTGAHTLAVPEWVERIDYVIFAGGGGGAGGNNHFQDINCGAGKPGKASLWKEADPAIISRTAKVTIDVGAGGEGGPGTSRISNDPNPGKPGGATTVTFRESSGAAIQTKREEGGAGGTGQGDRTGDITYFPNVSELLPGIVDKGQDLKPPAGYNGGGDGGSYGTSGPGASGTPGERGGDGWVKISFSTGY